MNLSPQQQHDRVSLVAKLTQLRVDFEAQAKTDFKQAHDAYEFFRKTWRLFSGDTEAEERECAICLEDDFALRDLSITPCGHLFCTRCITDEIRVRHKCAICRNDLKIADLEILSLQVEDYKKDEKAKEGDRKKAEAGIE